MRKNKTTTKTSTKAKTMVKRISRLKQPQARPLDVKETSFMHELLSADCAPQQEIREITENAFQAIEARAAASKKPLDGEVRWQMYSDSLSRYGVPKLCCIDNGEGMSAKELEEYIGRLSSSGRGQSQQGNFGLGAKISALQNNPAGVIYESWQKGVGHRTTLFRDSNGIPGLKKLAGGKVVEKLTKKEMPELVKQSGGYGTMVILLGEDEKKSDTLARPADYQEAKKDDWIAWTLNRRYYRIPDNIKLLSSPKQQRNPRFLNEVKGVEWFLANQAKAQGIMDVPGGKLYWTLLKHHKAYKALKPYYDSGAKVGGLHDDELYDYASSVTAQNRIQLHFGIPLGANQIALIFEPDDATSNTSRSAITVDKKPLPWDDWSRHFRRNMPDAIKEHVSQKQGETLGSDKHIKKALDTIISLGVKQFLVRSRGKATGGQALQAADATVTLENGVLVEKAEVEQIKEESTDDSTTPQITITSTVKPINSPKAPPSPGSLLAPGNQHEASRRKVNLDKLTPSCTWGKGRDLGMEGLLMRYIPDEKNVLLNEDAPVVKSVEGKWLALKLEQHTDAVKNKIREHFEVQAIETIILIKQLEGSEGWDIDSIAELLENDCALSLSASMICHMDNSLKMAMRNIPSR